MITNSKTYRSLLVSVIFAISLAVTNLSYAQGGSLLVLDVVPNGGDFSMVPDPGDGNQGPFYISGTIFAHGSNVAIGDFHCWGYFAQGGAIAVVSQEFDLDGRGKIQLAGVEDGGPRAIVGGTGEFRNVRGEVTGVVLDPFFTATFRLIGAKGED